MKFLIYSEKNMKKLASTKNLLMGVFPDSEIKTVGGKNYKSQKVDEGFLPIRLENFLSATDKDTVRKFCTEANVGISERVIESL